MSKQGSSATIGGFKTWLSLWIGLAMAAGLALGSAWPSAFHWLGSLTVAQVNPVTALLVWLLILPTMVQVNYEKLPLIWQSPQWRAGSAITLFVNWLVKPFTMAVLAVLFLKGVFAHWIPADDAEQFIAGLILLGIAPCTGMVFVWSRMTNGDPAFTLAQVALNDLVLILAFAPIAALLLDLSGIAVPWKTLTISTLFYVVAPLILGYGIRWKLLKKGQSELARFDKAAGPLTKIGLILLVVILFGLQAEQILNQPFLILLIAIPILLQSYGIFLLAFAAGWLARLPKAIVAPAAMIGTSNFFELAVAVAVSIFGVNSLAVVATVVGVLVEIPVMLSLIWLLNRTGARIDLRSQASTQAMI